ncbi:MAG: GAF domain-containing protein [Magnetococcales bacterium]|nr:GAF domain-containing protein [Magnetococcales bacterium]
MNIFVTSRARFLLLSVVMVFISISALGVMLFTLHEQGVAMEGKRLAAVAKNHARLLSTFSSWEKEEKTYSHEELIRRVIHFVEETHKGWSEGLGSSGEFVLAQRQGENMVILFRDQRGIVDSPIVIGWNQQSLAQPMQHALQKESGVLIGKDYRGVMVHAAYEYISNLEIGLVVKVDSDELHTPLLHAAWSAMAVSMVLILLGSLIFVRLGEAAIRQAKDAEDGLVKAMHRLSQEEDRASRLLILQQNSHELEEKELCDQAIDLAVKLTDSQIGYLHLINEDQQSVTLLSWNREALQRCTAEHYVHYSIDQAGVWADSIRLKRPVIHNDLPSLHHKKGFPEGHVEVRRHVSVPVLEGNQAVLVIGVGNKEAPYDEHDILHLQQVAAGVQKIVSHHRLLEQFRRNEKSLQRANRALTAISLASEAHLHNDNEQSFMMDVCRLGVEHAGYKMVWIGFLRHDADKSVEPSAWYGCEYDYLKGLQITWEDSERGRGPTGCAIRTGKPVLARNILNDPFFAPWRAQALAHGYASSLAVPLLMETRVIGTLNIYATEPDAFDEDEQRFLNDLTNHVSLGIQSFRQDLHARRLLAAMEQTRDMILISDQQGLVQYANQAFLAQTGQRLDEIMERDVMAAWTDQIAGETYAEALRLVQQGHTWQGRLFSRKGEGLSMTWEATLSPVKNAEGAIVSHVGVYRDVTHQSQIEAQLRQAQKVESIGTLAGGIAHDFNNILGMIIGYSELVMAKLSPELQEHQDMREVLTASIRARDLVAQLLAFSRQTDWECDAINLVPMVKEVVRFLRAVTPANIKLTVAVKGADCTLMGHPSQVHQILMNLSTNAIQAVRGRTDREVEVGLERIEILAPEAQTLMLAPGWHALLTVRDNGEGIPEHNLERIFDPFFTTKAVGEGTGLGLSVVHGHVSVLGGRVLVESRVGSGATFRVYLPLAEPAGERRKTPHHDHETSTFGLHVLLVDDEIQLNHVLTGHLAVLGCKAVSATNAADGMALLEANPGGFDLVITDQTMPDATGEEFLHALRKLEPDLPVILTSGYQLPFSEQELKAMGFFAFLPKPVLALDLVRLLRSLPTSLHSPAM